MLFRSELVIRRCYNEQISAMQAERDQFGFDHAELGSRVMAVWQLPPRLVTVTAHHHLPETFPQLDEEDGRVTAVVALASACLDWLGVGRREPNTDIQVSELLEWHFLGLSDEDADPILSSAAEHVKAAQALIR